MIRLLLLLAPLTACRSTEPASGTSVGNPGKLTPSLGSGDGIQIERAFAYVTFMEMVGCGGQNLAIEVDDELDLSGEDAITVPAGSYCGISIEMDELVFGADWRPDGAGLYFEMALTLEQGISAYSDASFDVQGNDMILEIGEPGWISADDVPVQEDGQVFDSDDEASTEAAQWAQATSALWMDDGDGQLDEDERDTEPLASADGSPPSTQAVDNAGETSDEGCATIAHPASGILAFLASICLWRRRTAD